ncbi:MAG: hypothetical protein EA385_10130 [Salinarimonadaceae bacterium]|nr:MAG: hypothetical protein EA385_10130 [Salinarimonadaceae bacterium]
MRHGISVVGVVASNQDGGLTDRAGVGWSAKIPTPAGEALAFFNFQQDWGTIGHLFQDRAGRHVVTANIGLGYSVSDGAAMLLAASFPKAGIPLVAGLEIAGADVWAGAVYQGQVVIENGVPQAVIISGVEVPLDRLAGLFSDPIESRAMSGGFRPEALRRTVLRDFDPRYTNIAQEGANYAAVIQRAFDRQLTDPTEQYRLLTAALDNPEAVFGAMSPNGRKAARMIVNSILGRDAEAERLARELYPHDNIVDGVRPRALSTLRIDSIADLDGSVNASVSGGAPSRVFYDYAGVAGLGQVRIGYNPGDGVYSAHGLNGSQHPLRGAATLEEAGDKARELIRNGGFAPQNLFPLQGHDGTPIATIPTDQAERVSQGFVGVPGVGQAELRYNTRDGVYSLHGRNGAQHPLRGAQTFAQARELARNLIRNGGFAPQNLFPLQGHDGTPIATIPTDQAERVSQGFVGVPGVGQAELRYNTRDGVYSLHGRNGAQHPLRGAQTFAQARELARALIANGGFSRDNLFPLQGYNGAPIATIPTNQSERVSQGFVGVPGVGQAELRYNTRDGVYSLHGRNGAQHPLPGAQTFAQARELARELIRNGGFAPRNLFPL